MVLLGQTLVPWLSGIELGLHLSVRIFDKAVVPFCVFFFLFHFATVMWSSRGPQLFLNEAAAVCSQLASLWFISRHVTKWMPLFIHRWKWDWLKNAVRHSVWVVCDVCWMTYAVVTGSWLVNPKRSKSHFLLLVFLFPLVWSLAGISLIRAHAFGAQVNVREDCNWTPPNHP